MHQRQTTSCKDFCIHKSTCLKHCILYSTVYFSPPQVRNKPCKGVMMNVHLCLDLLAWLQTALNILSAIFLASANLSLSVVLLQDFLFEALLYSLCMFLPHYHLRAGTDSQPPSSTFLSFDFLVFSFSSSFKSLSSP